MLLTGAPLLPYGSDLFDEVEDPNENIYVYEGRVLSASGDPIANAVLDVWHSDDHGFYDVQSDFRTSSSHLGFRGKFMTNEKGEWKFHTLPVKSYMLPRDGPVVSILLLLSYLISSHYMFHRANYGIV